MFIDVTVRLEVLQMISLPMIGSSAFRSVLARSLSLYTRVVDRYSSLASLKIVDAARMTKEETAMSEQVSTKVCIVGSGPAAHTAAIYAARAELSPIIFEGWMANGIAAGVEHAFGPYAFLLAFRDCVSRAGQFETP